MYKVNLNIGGKNYKAEAEDLFAALSLLKTEKITNKGLLTVSKDKLKSERLLPIPFVRRLINHEMYRTILAKQLNQQLK